MIYENNINLLSEKTISEQIEELTDGLYFLKDKNKFEEMRRRNKDNYYSGKITAKEYSEKNRILIQNVLTNIEKNYISDNLPF